MAEKGPDVKYFCFDCKKSVDEAERTKHEGHDIEKQSQALEKITECFQIICLNDITTSDERDHLIKFLEDLTIEDPRNLSTGPTIKIASWNLKTFDLNKVDLFKDKNIIEIVTNTIIKSGATVIAFQEIGKEGNALYGVLEQLKKSTGDDKWDIAVSEKYTGRMYPGMEYGAFIWNYSSGLIMTCEPYPVSLTKEDGTKMFVRKPYVGEFAIDKWEFSLVSFHLKCRNGGFANTVNDDEVKALHMVVHDLKKDSKNDIILLGDFNRSMAILPDSKLGKKNYTAIFEHSKYTNTAQSDCYDNIIIPRFCRKWISQDPKVYFPKIYKTQDGKIIFDHGLICASFKINITD